MALQDTDLLPLYRVSDSTNRKISVADLLSGASGVWTEDSGKLYPNTLSNNVQIGGTAADPNITLAADGSITADGLGEFKGGVNKVSGGEDTTVYTGMWGDTASLKLTMGGNRQLTISGDRALRVFPDVAGNTIGWQTQGVLTQAVTNARAFSSYINSSVNAIPDITHFEANQEGSVIGETVTGFAVRTNLQDGTTASYGFNSRLNTSTGPANFNFYAAGTAPNFLAGSTYIGGTTARNTFDLWKATLTEEQLETLEAGTLVAPANVSLPGDGSFARQWYYDQQDEETQAELDAGTLDYPEHLAAATFTDTFALGDNTNINLLSTGEAYFASNVGIGTASPLGCLDIGAPVIAGVPSIYLSRTPGVDTTSDIALTGNAVIRSENSIRNVINTGGVFTWDIGGTDVKAGTSGSSEMMRLNPSGNLGIGVASPQAKLDVNGTVRATTFDLEALPALP